MNILHKGSKSHLHAVHQAFFLHKLPEAKQEFWFPQIAQRADIFDEKRKIVFEIQLSKIFEQEILQRTRNYEYLGLFVVWIFPFSSSFFHRLSAKVKYFFSTINEQGRGEIFDLFKDQRLLVDITKAYPLLEETKGIYFQGDRQDQHIQGKLLEEKQKLGCYRNFIHKWFQKVIE